MLKSLTRADKIIAFAEKYLRVPEGALVGQPLILEDFQKDFIRDVYAANRKVRRAILSMARKNAKTTLIAILLIAHLVGPEAKQNTQIVSGAMSRDQAALVFELASKMIRMSPDISRLVKIIPSKKQLIGLPMNVEYKALAAEGKTAHGLSPILAILDEVGQVVGPQDDFIDAITTSQGAHENPLLMVISTQAASDSDLLSIMIDDAFESGDPNIVCHLYAAEPGCGVMDEEAWAAANPALGKFRSYEDLKEQAIQANRMPSKENSFRLYGLNQRVSVNSPLIAKDAWKFCGKKPIVPLHECEEIWAGLDLSGKIDLTAFVLYGKYKGEWYVYSYFWTPKKGLEQREKRDRAPYSLWIKQGFLYTTPGATVDYDFVAETIWDIVEPLGDKLKGIAFDRWRINILKKSFKELGVLIRGKEEDESLEEGLPLIDWGQGFKDMSPAIDAVEEVILNGTINHGNHPVLTMCASNVTTVKDSAGNRKLDKMKTSGRIDGLVALTMAAGLAQRQSKGEDNGNFDDFISNPIVAA